MLERPLAEAQATVFRPASPGWSEFELGRSAWDSAQPLLEVPERRDGALLLLRDAVDLLVVARLARAAVSTASSRAEQWSAFEHLAETRPALEPLSPSEREAVQQAFVAGDNARLAADSPAQRINRLRALEKFLPVAVDGLQREADRVSVVRGRRALRVGFAATLVAALLIVGVMFIVQRLRGTNLALHRRVTTSSTYEARRFPASGLVDGDTTKIGCHTQSEPRPWVRIDLDKPAVIHEVVVYNRTDFADRAIPLEIDVSTDGRAYKPFARRTELFNVWHAKGGPVQARFVRLTIGKTTALHFNEVQVF